MTTAQQYNDAVQGCEMLRRRVIELEAHNAKLEAVRITAQAVQREIYPRDVFVGCGKCHTRECDCDRGVQLARSLADALAASEPPQEDRENDVTPTG